MNIYEKIPIIWFILFMASLVVSVGDGAHRLDSPMYVITKLCAWFATVSIVLAIIIAIIAVVVS